MGSYNQYLSADKVSSSNYRIETDKLISVRATCVEAYPSRDKRMLEKAGNILAFYEARGTSLDHDASIINAIQPG